MAYLAGENTDSYSDLYQAREWVERQRGNKKPVFGFQCAGAYHALEFEPGIGFVGEIIHRVYGLWNGFEH